LNISEGKEKGSNWVVEDCSEK